MDVSELSTVGSGGLRHRHPTVPRSPARAGRGSARRGRATVIALAFATVLGLAVSSGHARAATVIPAFGGTEISLDTTAAGGSGVYRPLSIIAVDEVAPEDFLPGQTDAMLVLRAPAGFEFKPGAGVAFSGGGDLTALSLVSVTVIAVTLRLSTGAAATDFDFIEISGLEVRPDNTTPTVGQIYVPATGESTAVIAGVVATDAADGAPGAASGFGLLSSVAGTAPLLTVPGPLSVVAEAATGTPNPDQLGHVTAFLASATAIDSLDGSRVPVSNNAPPFFPLGITAVTFTATDARGVTASATSSVLVVTPGAAIDRLDEAVVALGLEARLEFVLRDKLREARREYDRGRPGAAIKRLSEFMTRVEVETGRGIAEADAASLEVEAQAIVDALRLSL